MESCDTLQASVYRCVCVCVSIHESVHAYDREVRTGTCVVGTYPPCRAEPHVSLGVTLGCSVLLPPLFWP